MPARLPAFAAVVAGLLLLPGCFSPYMAIPGRSAIDQQVTAAAIAAAVESLDLESLPVGAYRVEVSGPEEADTAWVSFCVRDRLVQLGSSVQMQPGPVVATLHIGVAYAGSDLEQTLIGVPLFVPGVPVSFGDVSLYSATAIMGRVRLAAQVFDSFGVLTRRLEGVRGRRFFKNWSFLTFFGDFVHTDLDEFSPQRSEQVSQ